MKAIDYLKAPIEYKHGYFYTADGKMIAQVRGWGWIQYKGDLEETAKLQDDIGEFIASAITKAVATNEVSEQANH